MRITTSMTRGVLLAVVELSQRGRVIGVRQLTSREPSCVELAQALAIVVALALDVHSSGEADAGQADAEGPPSAPYEVPQEPTEDPDITEVSPFAVQDSAELKEGMSLRLGGEATFGLVPHPQLGIGLGAVHGMGPLLELDVGLSAFPWSATSSLPKQRAEIDYRAFLGRASVCVKAVASLDVRVGVCAGVSAGAMHTVSRGLGEARPTLSPLVNGVLSTTLRLRLDGGWLAVFSVGLNLPWLRKEFVYSALDGATPTAYRMPAQFGSLGIGFEYELGNRPDSSQNARASAIHF